MTITYPGISYMSDILSHMNPISSMSRRQEHITSDIGSVGDFAAGSEVAFGTILQRTYSVLGARMHYGHPDIMNKQPLGGKDLGIDR